jgi:gas vesicle protein
MSDYDEGYVIIERRTGNFGTFVWGMLLGGAAALLFAPKSGRETRRELTDTAYRIRDQAEEKVREVQDTVTDTVHDVRRQFEEGIETARRAVESGKEAARASRDEVERQVRQSSAAFRSGYEAARAGELGHEDDPGMTDTPPPQDRAAE